jgi:hypothetical protein
MDWIRQNKFAAALLGVVAVVAIVLVVLGLSASGRHSEIADQYEQQAAELRRLENLKPYPNADNLKKLEEQKEQYAKAVQQLRERLNSVEFHVEPMTPEQFQDQLRASVSAITAKAKENNVKPPDNFYLGFDRYSAEPPAREAATVLGKQLKAIEFVVNQLIENKVDAIATINRIPLPQETGGAAAAPTPRERRNQAPETEETRQVQRYPFEIGFTAEQSRFRRALNALVNTDKQFFVVRRLNVKNQQEKGPPRQEETPPPQPPGPPEGQPAEGQPGAPQPTPGADKAPIQYLVGAEKIDVLIGIDILDFAEVAAK